MRKKTDLDDSIGDFPTSDPGPLPELPDSAPPPRPSRPAALPFDPSADPGFAARYRVESVLGRGGMGVVLRGTQLALGRPVAIKFVTGASPRALERFERERQLVARLNHPNVVQVHDAGTMNDLPYLVMELVDGVTLRDTLDRRGGRLPLDEALALVRQMLDGLEYVHAQSAIHRDLKPANVFVTHTGVLKLGDFGLAWAEDQVALTGTADAMGTPGYMPPEQFLGPVYAPSADLYSVGAVLYELLTGRLPLNEGSLAGLIIAHRQNRRPVPLRSVDPALPAHIEALLASAMEKNPELRPQSAARFRALLDEPRAVSVALAPAPVDPPAPEPAPVTEPASAHGWVTFLVAGLAVAGWLFHARAAEVPAWPSAPAARAADEREALR